MVRGNAVFSNGSRKRVRASTLLRVRPSIDFAAYWGDQMLSSTCCEWTATCIVGRDRNFQGSAMSKKVNIDGNRSSYACLMGMAERELAAFIAVVTDSYGSEQAMVAAQDWIEELESMDELPGLKSSDWRPITIAAAARLASRLGMRPFYPNSDSGPLARAEQRHQ